MGRTTTTAAENGGVAMVQVALNQMETLDRQVLLQHFGFASGLPVGTDTIHLFINGDRSNGLIVGTNHQASRPRTLGAGQSMLYDQAGTQILLSNDGNVTVKTGGVLTVVGDLHVTGDIVWSSDSTPTDAAGHVHGGVMAGAGDTSPPIAGS